MCEEEQESLVFHCKGNGCEKTSEGTCNAEHHEWARSDFHGIFTGLYCDNCYENNYPYRRDDYTEGTGIADDGTPLETDY